MKNMRMTWNDMYELGVAEARQLSTAMIQAKVAEMKVKRQGAGSEEEKLNCTAFIEGVNSIKLNMHADEFAFVR